VKTTMEWSHYLLGETPALDMADFALPVNPDGSSRALRQSYQIEVSG
jgi:hypothetical protein